MVRIPFGRDVKYNDKTQQLFDRVCDDIKEVYASQGETLFEQEAIEATRNWLGFCEKLLEIDPDKETNNASD